MTRDQHMADPGDVPDGPESENDREDRQLRERLAEEEAAAEADRRNAEWDKHMTMLSERDGRSEEWKAAELDPAWDVPAETTEVSTPREYDIETAGMMVTVRSWLEIAKKEASGKDTAEEQIDDLAALRALVDETVAFLIQAEIARLKGKAAELGLSVSERKTRSDKGTSRKGRSS